MPCTGYRTACSKRWPCRRGDRIKRIPTERQRCPKGNAAYAAMEAITQARDWQEEAKRLYDQQIAEAVEAEEVHNDAIKRTLEKTDALEKHVKTVTLRTDSLAATEADFFQALPERQEEAMRDINVLYGQLCQSSPTQIRPRAQCPCAAKPILLISNLASVCLPVV